MFNDLYTHVAFRCVLLPHHNHLSMSITTAAAVPFFVPVPSHLPPPAASSLAAPLSHAAAASRHEPDHLIPSVVLSTRRHEAQTPLVHLLLHQSQVVQRVPNVGAVIPGNIPGGAAAVMYPSSQSSASSHVVVVGGARGVDIRWWQRLGSIPRCNVSVNTGGRCGYSETPQPQPRDHGSLRQLFPGTNHRAIQSLPVLLPAAAVIIIRSSSSSGCRLR